MPISWTPLTIALTCATLVAASPAVAGAAVLPTLGAADGVTATRAGTSVEIRLAGAAATAAAAYADKELTVNCDTRPRPGLLLRSGADSRSSGADGTLRRQADGSLALKVILQDRAWDTCEISRPGTARRRVGRQGPLAIYRGELRAPLARVALTAAGAAWIDELGRAVALDEATTAAQRQSPSGVLTPEQLAAAGLVALPDEGATPPAGSVGYWTDGHGRNEVVTLSAAGRRLIEGSSADGTQRSNVGGFTNQVAELRDTPVFELETGQVDRDATSTPLGQDDDAVPLVRSSVSGMRLAVRFAGRARATFRRLAGRRVSVACGPAELPSAATDARGLLAGFQLVSARVPRTGSVLRARLRAGHGKDVCLISDDDQRVATTAPTAAGRALLQDVAAIGRMLAAAGLAPATATTYPSAVALAAADPKTLVAVGAPTAFPPRGDRIGVWTDGAHQAVLSTVSPAGHRFFMADEGDGVVRENTSGPLVAGLLVASF